MFTLAFPYAFFLCNLFFSVIGTATGSVMIIAALIILLLCHRYKYIKLKSLAYKNLKASFTSSSEGTRISNESHEQSEIHVEAEGTRISNESHEQSEIHVEAEGTRISNESYEQPEIHVEAEFHTQPEFVQPEINTQSEFVQPESEIQNKREDSPIAHRLRSKESKENIP